MKNSHMFAIGGALVAGTVALAPAGAHAQDVSMTFAHSENPNAMIAAESFKQMVEDMSGGDIEVNLIIHHALGGDRDVVDQLRIGEVEAYVPGMHALAELSPSTQIFGAPFLFRDRAEFFEVMKDDEFVAYLRDWILEDTNDQIRLEGAAENSVRYLYTAHGPINTPDDLGPVSLRVPPTPINIALWEALGPGDVTGMPGADRDQGLQTGVIDGIEGSAAGAWSGGRMDNLEHVTLTGHVYSYMPYLYNNDFWEGLSDDHQQVLRMATRLAIWVQNGHAITEEQDALVAMAEAGNQVNAPSPSEIEVWQEVAGPVREEFIEENVDPEFAQRVFQAIEDTRERIWN